MTVGTIDYSQWRTMRELDEAAGMPKGSAFRAFKAAISELQEGCDFVVLDKRKDERSATSLIVQARLYRSSVAPVLLAPAAAARIRAMLITAASPTSR